MTKYIAYYRVSTEKQGESGLGLEAQQRLVESFVARDGGELIESFSEVASGTKCDREVIAKALRHCELKNATLLVASLDRLARDVGFLNDVSKSPVKFICVDMPDANKMVLGILATVAEDEARRISKRIKAACDSKRVRGEKMGNAEIYKLSPQDPTKARAQQEINAAEWSDRMLTIINENGWANLSLRQIAGNLNDAGFTARRGGKLHASSVKNIIGQRIKQQRLTEAVNKSMGDIIADAYKVALKKQAQAA